MENMRNAESIKQEIDKRVNDFLLGTLAFIVLSFLSIFLGLYIICSDGFDATFSVSLLILGGSLLLLEVVRVLCRKYPFPAEYRRVARDEYPSLFRIIDEVTANLSIHGVDYLYITPGTDAAVVVRPTFLNFFRSSQKELILGMGYITQMNDDEIKAMLYHEFGHYIQPELRNSASVYIIGSLTKYFVSKNEMKERGSRELMYESFKILYTFYVMQVFAKLEKLYSRLETYMECEADDVAVKFVGASLLRDTLIHASSLHYNYMMMQWGIGYLNSYDIDVDDVYKALHFVSKYSHPSCDVMSQALVKRIERLDNAMPCECKEHACTVRDFVPAFMLAKAGAVSCSAVDFAAWLKEGSVRYGELVKTRSSVFVNIFMPKRRHKLPLFDSRYRVLLDDKPVGMGNFIKGYDIKCRTSPGKHVISVYLPSGIISTPFTFEAVAGGRYKAEMDYKLHFMKSGSYEIFVHDFKEVD